MYRRVTRQAAWRIATSKGIGFHMYTAKRGGAEFVH
jgi:hypothetical protein